VKKDILHILLTALISALIAALQTYLVSITGTHIPDINTTVAALNGGVIATALKLNFA